MGIKLKIKNIIYKSRMRKSNVVFGKNTNVYGSVFEGYNKINNNTTFSKGYIGIGSYIGKNSSLNEAKIGRFASIGNNIKIIAGKHPINKFVSTHPAFFSMRKQAGFTFVEKQIFDEYNKVENKYSIIIGNDVWIGEDVRIMEGVIIGDGAVIGANSLVTKNVEAYSINGGVPSKIIKYRFDKEYIEKLLKFKWWNYDISWIKGNLSIFNDINELIEYMGDKNEKDS